MTDSPAAPALGSQTIGEFLTSLGAKTPAPGGGAVASVTAALAASIGSMVVRYSEGKKKLAEHADLHARAIEELGRAACRSLELAEEYARAYTALNALWRLDESDPERIEHWDAAVRDAIAAPQSVLESCLAMLALLRELAGRTNRFLDSDLAIAAILAEAGVRAAAWNVRINLPSVRDADEVDRLNEEVSSGLDRAAMLCREIEAACSPAG